MTMKKILISLIFATPLYANTYLFDQIATVEDLDANFIMDNSNNSDYFANLDCQSFFQKLDFYENDQLITENFLNISECEFIYGEILQCFKEGKSKCFSTENIFKQGCDC